MNYHFVFLDYIASRPEPLHVIHYESAPDALELEGDLGELEWRVKSGPDYGQASLQVRHRTSEILFLSENTYLTTLGEGLRAPRAYYVAETGSAWGEGGVAQYLAVVWDPSTERVTAGFSFRGEPWDEETCHPRAALHFARLYVHLELYLSPGTARERMKKELENLLRSIP